MHVEMVVNTKIVDAGTFEFTMPLPSENSRLEGVRFVPRENLPRSSERTSSEILPGVVVSLR